MQDKLRDLYAERLGIDNYEGGALIGARKKRRAPAKGKKAVINALVKAMTSKRKARGKGYIGGEDYENDYMGAALIGARKRRPGRPKKTRKYKGKGEYSDMYDTLTGGSVPYYNEALKIAAVSEAGEARQLLKLNPTPIELLKASRDLYDKVIKISTQLEGLNLEDADINSIVPKDISALIEKKAYKTKMPYRLEEYKRNQLKSLYPGVNEDIIKAIYDVATKITAKSAEQIKAALPEMVF